MTESSSESAGRGPWRSGVAGLSVCIALAAILAASARAAAPSNDNFASPQVLTGPQPIVVSGTTRDATREPADPASFDGSVWYRWTAPASGRFAIEFCAQNSAAAQSLSVSLYSGDTLQALQEVFRTDLRPSSGDCPFGESGDTPEVYDLVAGTTYRI